MTRPRNSIFRLWENGAVLYNTGQCIQQFTQPTFCKCTSVMLLFWDLKRQPLAENTTVKKAVSQAAFKCVHNSPTLFPIKINNLETYMRIKCTRVPLQKFPIYFKIFQWKCLLENETGLALSKITGVNSDRVLPHAM